MASAAGGDGNANAATEGFRQQLADAAEEQAAVEEELVELREAVKVAEASVQTPLSVASHYLLIDSSLRAGRPRS